MFRKVKKSLQIKMFVQGRKIKLKGSAGPETNGHEQNQNKLVMKKFSLEIRRLVTIRESKHRNSIPR